MEKLDLAWLDSLEFDAIPAPEHYYDLPRLSVRNDGQMRMNPGFLRKLGEARRFCGMVSRDGRCLALRPDGEGQIAFTPKGVCRNHALAARLCERGIELPAVYSMEWLPERELWAGCSGDLPAPPPAGALLPRGRGGKRGER